MLKPIKTRNDHKRSLDRIYKLLQMELEENSDEINELEILSVLVDDYENREYPISAPDPIEAIKFRLDQLNLKQGELAKILGSKSRASEILNRKRKLSLSMIRTLHHKLNIPAASLISDY